MRILYLLATMVLTMVPLAAAQDSPGAAPADSMTESDFYSSAPEEPNLTPVKFLKQEPPATLTERIERLLQGISVDVPPEYDIYGYELRRYMAHIGGEAVYNDGARIKEELKNIAKARIILRYWIAENHKEMKEINDLLETQNASSTERSSFRYNQGIVLSFEAAVQNWITTNEDLLKYLDGKQGRYTYKDQDFNFDWPRDRGLFLPVFRAREKARTELAEFRPFAIMAY